MPTLRARVLTPLGPDDVRHLDDAVVAWDQRGRITEVVPYDGRNVDHDLRPALLCPGFVDAHVHFPQTRIIGAATGPLLPWLENSVFPEEQRFSDPDHASRVAEMFCSALASAGTTLAFVYSSVHPEASDWLLRVMDRRGLRGLVGPVLMDAHTPPELTLPPELALPALEELVDTWHGHDDWRLQVAVIPRFALSCSERMLREAGELAQSKRLWVSTHLSENQDECRVARERFGTDDYLTIYEDAGLLHERSLYAHCIHLSDGEWERFRRADAVVAHCPDSNFFLGSGNMPLDTVLEREIPMALGTDVGAGRTFSIPHIASSAYDNALQVEHPVTPLQLFWWTTRGGALALGQPNVGALAPGLEADMVLVDVPHWAESLDQTLAWMLNCRDAPLVRRTWVRGKVVWDRAGWSRHGGSYPWRNDPRSAPVGT